MTESSPEQTTEIVHRIAVQRARSLDSELQRWAITVLITVVVAVGLLGSSLVAAIYMAAGTNETQSVDAVVVMGAAQFNGVPSAVLQARLDTTFRVWSSGIAPVIIVTGGKMPGDNFTESESSRDYLVDLGVPEDAILMESEGRNSEASLRGVAEIARANDIKTVLIVSDGFHLFRSKLIAEHNNLTAYGVSATDSPINRWSSTEFDYVLREAAGVVAYLLP